MTLQIKFVILIGLVSLAVLVSLATALWSSQLQQAVARDVMDMPRVLDALSEMRETTVRLEASLPTGLREGQGVPVSVMDLASRERGRQASEALAMQIERLESSDFFLSWAGFGTSAALSRGVSTCQQQAEAWFESSDPETGRVLLQRIDALRRLLAHCEGQALAQVTSHIEDTRLIHGRLMRANIFAFAGTMLMGVLAWFLLRRWVVQPVRALREAAAHIGEGDFAYRLPVTGRDEIAQLNAEVNHMAGMITSMQEERIEQERFAAIGQMVRRLAHNLRNPLAGIRGLAELTRNDLPDDSALRENQDRIMSSVDKFEQWLSELLDVTSPLEIRRRHVKVPREWLRELIDAHEPMARTRRVDLEASLDDGLEEAWFDDRHLGHALVAMVSNGIEAAGGEDGSQGHVRISSSVSDDAAEWVVRIEDDGPGIPPDLLDRIFAAHFTTKSGGNGIGLAVAQQIVRAHGGRIVVDGGTAARVERTSNAVIPRENGLGGAMFEVRLPRDQPTDAGNGAAAAGDWSA